MARGMARFSLIIFDMDADWVPSRSRLPDLWKNRVERPRYDSIVTDGARLPGIAHRLGGVTTNSIQLRHLPSEEGNSRVKSGRMTASAR